MIKAKLNIGYISLYELWNENVQQISRQKLQHRNFLYIHSYIDSLRLYIIVGNFIWISNARTNNVDFQGKN